MQKIFKQFFAAVFFNLFFLSVIVDESFVKFLVAGFFKEQFFYHSGQIVNLREVTKKPNYDSPVEAVDAAYNADLVHPVIPNEFSVNLEVINSHIKVDQVFALFIGRVIRCRFLDSCARKDVSLVFYPVQQRLAIK
jgi:hypothetical protein